MCLRTAAWSKNLVSYPTLSLYFKNGLRDSDSSFGIFLISGGDPSSVCTSSGVGQWQCDSPVELIQNQVVLQNILGSAPIGVINVLYEATYL